MLVAQVTRTAPFIPGVLIPGLIGTMLATSRHWEQMEEIRERCGLEPEPPPFHQSVMALLARINKIRVALQREQMQRQLEHHQKQAKIARRREAFRPNVSRRVLNERRNTDSARAQGTTGPVLSGTGVE